MVKVLINDKKEHSHKIDSAPDPMFVFSHSVSLIIVNSVHVPITYKESMHSLMGEYALKKMAFTLVNVQQSKVLAIQHWTFVSHCISK